MKSTMRLLGAIVSLVILTAGCTGTDTPTSPPSAPALTISLPPVDTYRDKPCTLLTTFQWSDLGFDGDGQEVRQGDCVWRKTQPNRSMSLGFYSNYNPLKATCLATKGEVIEPVTIDEYPARRCVQNSGRACEIALDTRQEQKIVVRAGGEDAGNWCAKAATAIGYILHNLK